MKNQSTLLLYLQDFFMILFIIVGEWFAINIFLLIIELAAIALGAWAIMHMAKYSKFRARPDPAKEARLLATGPYTYIRNPMYAAVILGFTALLIDSFTWIRFTIYILEIIVLLKKISFEETALAEKFPAYAAYKSRTRRLIPFFY